MAPGALHCNEVGDVARTPATVGVLTNVEEGKVPPSNEAMKQGSHLRFVGVARPPISNVDVPSDSE
eukprot:2737864-Lingulodinium_polyedra.AAC.1